MNLFFGIVWCVVSDRRHFVNLNVLQEVEFLTSSITQLKVAQTKFVEAKDSLNVLSQNNKGE